MGKPVVLVDASFLIALEREAAVGSPGPACRYLSKLRGRKLVLSVVTVEELLEGAVDEVAALKFLTRFTIQPLGLAHARRCARNQYRSRKRMGENDAWMVATADLLGADILGADRKAFERLESRYLRFNG